MLTNFNRKRHQNRYGFSAEFGPQGLEAIENTAGNLITIINESLLNGVGTDDGSKTTWHPTPSPYGKTQGKPGQYQTYKGKLYDPTGLINMGARYYDPETSEFLSPGPYGYTGTTNLYTYANADPINYHDPDGRLYQSAHATIAPKVSSAWNVGSLLVGLSNEVSLDTTHTSLDVMGMVPVAGAVPDLVNAGMYSARGKYTDAGFSLAAATPIVGLVATPGKYANKLLGTSNGANIIRHQLTTKKSNTKFIKHHIFNKFRGKSPMSEKYRRFFKNHNIEVDNYAVKMPDVFHREWIHRAGNNWTTQWKKWIDANPNASSKEVFQNAGKMMDQYGINHLPILKYK